MLTVVLGQLISNTATVLIMVPIATVLAADLHVSVLPFMWPSPWLVPRRF